MHINITTTNKVESD